MSESGGNLSREQGGCPFSGAPEGRVHNGLLMGILLHGKPHGGPAPCLEVREQRHGERLPVHAG